MSLVGMLLGMAVIRLASGAQPLIWACFLGLTVVHLWANVRAMRCLHIASINQPRLTLLLRAFLERVRGGAGGGWACVV